MGVEGLICPNNSLNKRTLLIKDLNSMCLFTGCKSKLTSFDFLLSYFTICIYSLIVLKQSRNTNKNFLYHLLSGIFHLVLEQLPFYKNK